MERSAERRKPRSHRKLDTRNTAPLDFTPAVGYSPLPAARKFSKRTALLNTVYLRRTFRIFYAIYCRTLDGREKKLSKLIISVNTLYYKLSNAMNSKIIV